ncbi:CpsD/CapB family tyrosine-protein kinase [Ligilactobacillus salivarius]|uniref:CpsD/CapB family tyrosine-protein kinase n=1 Tax=Ligilactobacillus salivarius TaxID=1624 RepID=UPI0023AF6BA7|nr:CpsD/CapB family tyrosine-protein kinase [Ligilactobacillus salivarius]MDE7522172.1 CpsD/CapB family tyrosine-protein kinase [Ligilactobacillus salivarius]
MALFKKKNKLDTNSMEKGVYLVTVAKPTSVDTEQFNIIRTNITFSSADTEYKSLMITSSVASEGKSTMATNIAASFAKQGLSTLLVDADLRRPTIASTFGIADPRGLTNFLTDREFDINDVIYGTTVDNLFVIPAGPIPPNPSELIGSRRMNKLREALEEKLDLVIYDAPPVLSVTDAQLLSAKVDGTILIVRQGFAEKEEVRQAVDLLKHVNAHIIGAVLNDVDASTDGYYGYYGYGKEK